MFNLILRRANVLNSVEYHPLFKSYLNSFNKTNISLNSKFYFPVKVHIFEWCNFVEFSRILEFAKLSTCEHNDLAQFHIHELNRCNLQNREHAKMSIVCKFVRSMAR